jgi:selenocysteine lyase/cysteine desulfurase
VNANELANELDGFLKEQEQLPWGTKQVYLDQAATMLRQQQAEIERMIEKQSHYEAMAHAGGFEAGRQQGMKQERALWELAASTQEIEK